MADEDPASDPSAGRGPEPFSAAAEAIDALLAGDAALAEELCSIASHLSEPAAARFWAALAARLERAERPAAAVLGALEAALAPRSAIGGGGADQGAGVETSAPERRRQPAPEEDR